MEEIGAVTIDEDMGLDAVSIQLEREGRTVTVGTVFDPEPGRYVLSREVSE